jgi:hypothetical protein
MSKRSFSESEEEDTVPVNWRPMLDQEFLRFAIFDSNPETIEWKHAMVHYPLKALAILQHAFKPLWCKGVLFEKTSDCLMWNDLPTLPHLHGYVKNPNLARDLLSLAPPVMAAVKKPAVTGTEYFQMLEKTRQREKVDYYEIPSDDEDKPQSSTLSPAILKRNVQLNAVLSLVQIVEELESINFKITGIDMIQNPKRLKYHYNFRCNEKIDESEVTTVYHGTSEKAMREGILRDGLMITEAQRTMHGGGIYTTTSFAVARDYAMEWNKIDKSTAIVLVLSCYMGKIRTIHHGSVNSRSFVDESGKRCHTRYIASHNFHVISNESQLLARFAIRFQVIDNRNIFPAKIQAKRDLVAKQAAIDEAKLALLEQTKRDLQAKIALDAEIARKANPANAVQADKSSNNGGVALMSPNSDDEKDIRESLIAKHEKKRLHIEKRAVMLPSSNIDLHMSEGIIKGNTVTLIKMTKVNSFLEGCSGRIRQIVRDTPENKSRVYYMVEMDDCKHHSQISQNNKKKEHGQHGPSYVRFGDRFNTKYFICRRDKMKL